MKSTALRLAPLALAALTPLLALPADHHEDDAAAQVATVGEAAPTFRLNDHTALGIPVTEIVGYVCPGKGELRL